MEKGSGVLCAGLGLGFRAEGRESVLRVQVPE